ncbi:MAG: hypothetical protein M3R38_22620 [Actinomycetota bacterium]|nr:hypothetical protein [Actinomycetota bacterium]
MVAYRHDEDIDTEYSVGAEELDDKVELLVQPLALAFERSEDLGASFRHLMADQLRQFLDTHRSIRLLTKQRGRDLAAASDAMSLAREQIEKVYVVAMLLEGPEEWTMRYLKDDWRRGYERYLLDEEERAGLPRFREFFSGYAPEHVEKERLQLGVTEGERELAELRYRDPGAKVPSHLKDSAGILRRFPTPWRVIERVSDATLKDGLGRWYREYGYFSGYSHAGFPKLMARYYEASKRYTSSQKEEAVEKEYDQALWASYLAAATACAEAGLRELPRFGGAPARVADLEIFLKLDGLWDVMRRAALLGKALWELRVRHIMPPILGAGATP